jgi:hypothetical protein
MEWEICNVNDKFMVGKMELRNKLFDPICSCEFYDQADLICAALKHYIYAKNYSGKGVGGCRRVTGKFSKPIARMGLLE